jgi:hypothetical protein
MNTRLLSRLSSFVLLAGASIGCVSKGTYDEAVAQTEVTRAELTRTNAELTRTNAALAQLKSDAQRRAQQIGQLE